VNLFYLLVLLFFVALKWLNGKALEFIREAAGSMPGHDIAHRNFLPSVLSCRWLDGRKGIQSVKN